MVFKPGRPLKRYIGACSCWSSNSRWYQRTESTCNTWRGNIVDWTSSVSYRFLVAIHDTFDTAREFQINTRVESRIATILLSCLVPVAVCMTYVVPSMVMLSSIPCPATRAAEPRNKIDHIFFPLSFF